MSNQSREDIGYSDNNTGSFSVTKVRCTTAEFNWLGHAGKTNNFFKSLHRQAKLNDLMLSPKQHHYVKQGCSESIITKGTSKPVIPQTQQELEHTCFNFLNWQTWLDKFELAQESGIKYPKIYIVLEPSTANERKVAITTCTSESRYFGQFNIKIDNEFFCRVNKVGEATKQGSRLLFHIDASLRKLDDSIKIYGQRFGECCFCGRELTDPTSIDSNVGPICADKYGVPWERKSEELQLL